MSDSGLFFLYFRSSSRIKLKFLVAESNVLCFHKYRRKQRNFQTLLTVFKKRFRVFSLLYINFSVFQVISPHNKSVMKFLVVFLTLCLALASDLDLAVGDSGSSVVLGVSASVDSDLGRLSYTDIIHIISVIIISMI